MVQRCNERFFQFPIGCWCGVLIREAEAKKLQKILWRQTQEIKDFLVQNIEALEAANWTLAYIPKQTTVHYYDSASRSDVKSRINLLDKADRLTFVPDVFKTDKAGADAMEDVGAFYTEHYGENEGGGTI